MPQPASLEDDDSILVIAEHVEEVLCELGIPQLAGQSGIESLKVINGRVALE